MWPEMVRPAGFEPAAFGSGAQCAIQVSYFCLPLVVSFERWPVTPVIRHHGAPELLKPCARSILVESRARGPMAVQSMRLARQAGQRRERRRTITGLSRGDHHLYTLAHCVRRRVRIAAVVAPRGLEFAERPSGCIRAERKRSAFQIERA